MFSVCLKCQKIYGKKDPLEDRSCAYGLCADCFKECLRLRGVNIDFYKELNLQGGESVVERRSSRKEVLS